MAKDALDATSRTGAANLSIIVLVVVDPVPTSSRSSTLTTATLCPSQLALTDPPIVEHQQNPSEPDMGAVYILLGCLAVSGLVVLGILAYCTSYCWRKRCFKSRRTVPSIKISSSSEDAYLALKQRGSNMNGRPKVIVTTVDEQTSIVYPTNSASANRRTSTDPLVGGYQSTTTSANGRYYNKYHRRYSSKKKHNAFDHTALSPMPAFNGTVLSLTSPTSKESNKLIANGHIRKDSAGFDPLSDEIERRSVLHYDIGYYEKGHTGCIRGTLTFALRFDCIHRVLMVHLIRASHLSDKDHSSISLNPYVKMYLLPERRYHCKSKIYRKTLDPEFNEMFSFDAPYSSLSSRMLQFTLYDFDRFTRHGLIGNVIMRDLFEKSDLHSWTEYSMAIVGDNEKDDYGDLLLYLSYDAHDAKLTVSVAKACNLRPMDITGASDPYVKMTQLQGRRRVKTRRTTMKRANLHPVYNEVLAFDLPESQIGNSSLLIKVMDWDRIGHDELLGCCILGSESPMAEGREHWRQCFLRQHEKPVGMWHSLLAEVPEGFTNTTK